jgi:autotransporter passenger strand-loop-strand repeat protein
VVGSGGMEVVAAGGTASATVVGNGGIGYVYGSTTGSLVASGGAEYVLAGGALDGATLSGGLIEIASSATAGSSQIAFTSAGGTLQLDDAQHFSCTIAGFGVPGVIDLRDIAFGSGTTLGYSGNTSSGTLTVSDGTHAASIVLIGQYVQAQFATQADGNGGTLVTDPPLAGPNSLVNPRP